MLQRTLDGLIAGRKKTLRSRDADEVGFLASRHTLAPAATEPANIAGCGMDSDIIPGRVKIGD
jgi:hypothetical protein